jgi:DNA invertase Pin-like site-specific DNA recombinase
VQTGFVDKGFKIVGNGRCAAGHGPGVAEAQTRAITRDSRPGLDACLAALAPGDTPVIWKLDRLGRSRHHLVNTVGELTTRGIGLKVLTGEGAMIDTTTASGRLMLGIFAALAEFERELIVERTRAGIAAAQASGMGSFPP